MKHLLKLSALFAGLILFSGCKENENWNGERDNALVAKWYLYQSHANSGSGTVIFEFTADGRYIVSGSDSGRRWTTRGNKIIMSVNKKAQGAADYNIDGTVLTISNAELISGLVEGTYYKPSGENGGSNGGGSTTTTGVKIINNSGGTLNQVYFYYTATSTEIYTDNNAAISNGTSKIYKNLPNTSERTGVQVKRSSGNNARWYQGFYLNRRYYCTGRLGGRIWYNNI